MSVLLQKPSLTVVLNSQKVPCIWIFFKYKVSIGKIYIFPFVSMVFKNLRYHVSTNLITIKLLSIPFNSITSGEKWRIYTTVLLLLVVLPELINTLLRFVIRIVEALGLCIQTVWQFVNIRFWGEASICAYLVFATSNGLKDFCDPIYAHWMDIPLLNASVQINKALLCKCFTRSTLVVNMCDWRSVVRHNLNAFAF